MANDFTRVDPLKAALEKKRLREAQATGAHTPATVGAHSTGDAGIHTSTPNGAYTPTEIYVHTDTPARAQEEKERETLREYVGAKREVRGVNTHTQKASKVVNTPTLSTSGSTQQEQVYSYRRDRHALNKRKVNFYLEDSKVEEFKHFCIEAKLTMTEFFERAGAHYIEAVRVHQEENKGVNAPHDDLIDNRTLIDIIMLYKKYTGNHWRPNDDKVGRLFNDVDRRLIEIAIIETTLRANGRKINSFAYFKPEIEVQISVKLQDESVNEILAIRRRQFESRKS